MRPLEIAVLDCGEICLIESGLPDVLICAHCCQARRVIERL